jgi:hypothetical protein
MSGQFKFKKGKALKINFRSKTLDVNRENKVQPIILKTVFGGERKTGHIAMSENKQGTIRTKYSLNIY